MKEITRIHLAQTPFNIEIEAKKMLERYLASVQKAVGADEDTMREIEARIIEIVSERGIKDDRVITSADIEAVEAKLGSPRDFVDDEAADEAHMSTEGKRRLLRDAEYGMLGGVCAGIARYIGCNVMWPRLVAVLLAFITGGMAILVYIVLWIVIPPARTAAEKLQMRGEPITLAAIQSETVREEKSDKPERSKPLVILLRICLGLACIALGLAAIGVIVAAVMVRESLFGASMHDLTGGGILTAIGGAYVAAVLAGVLFIALMVLGTYASLTWRVNKKLLLGGAIVIVLGLASFGTAIGLGAYGANEVNREIAGRRVSETLSVPSLSGIQTMTIENKSPIPVRYVVTNTAPYVVINHLRGQSTVRFDTTNEGAATLKTVIHEEGSCSYTGDICTANTAITVYGPALKHLTLSQGTATYSGTTGTIDVDVARSADLSLEGVVTSLHVSLRGQARLEASSAAVQDASIVLGQASTVEFGTLGTLTVTAPTACATGEQSRVNLVGASALTVNNQPTPLLHASSNCLTVRVDENDAEF